MSLSLVRSVVTGKGAVNSLKDLFLQKLGESASGALLTTGLGLPFYLTQYSPEQAIALAALDAGASTVLGAGVGTVATKVRNKGMQTAINPEFQKKLDLLNIKPDATPSEINAAYSAGKKQILKQYPDLSQTVNGQSIGVEKIRELQQAVKSVKSLDPKSTFTQVPASSKLVDFATTTPDILFTAFAMPQIENLLAKNNITQPKYNLNPGLTPQDQIIQQQLASSQNQGRPNNAVLSPGTMSQQSNAEPNYADPNQLMEQLLAQAMSEKNASLESYAMDNYAVM